MMLQRAVELPQHTSFFLFGPRGVGKSTLLRQQPHLRGAMWIDLLLAEEEDTYARRPATLAERVAAAPAEVGWVVIDEVQKVPRLLDAVHALIESGRCRFALTGSSARRLKAGGANLLAGRASVCELNPLTSVELGAAFDLDSALHWGSLPRLVHLANDEERLSFLRAYALTYLKEEVWGEHLVRRLDPFRRFLEVAAQANGQIVNASAIARDVGADSKTVQSYFQILEDTLVGFMLEPYQHSFRKRLSQHPKFYLFDTGVARALQRTLTVPLLPQTYAFGAAFEHFVILEARRLHACRPRDYRFSYLRTRDGVEIDLIVERPGRELLAIEIKSSEQVTTESLTGFSQALGDLGLKMGYCLSREPLPRRLGNIEILPWREGLTRCFIDG